MICQGFKKEDVDIEVEEDSIIINAKRSKSEEDRDKSYIRQERSSQTFYRKIHLPEALRTDRKALI